MERKKKTRNERKTRKRRRREARIRKRVSDLIVVLLGEQMCFN